MSTEEINKAAKKYAAQNDGIYPSPVFRFVVKRAFNDGAEYALSHQWRDPKVELPENNNQVLVETDASKDLRFAIAYYDNNVWNIPDDWYYDCKIIRWMPIPEIPKPEEK